jgi:hypothetical protein
VKQGHAQRLSPEALKEDMTRAHRCPAGHQLVELGQQLRLGRRVGSCRFRPELTTCQSQARQAFVEQDIQPERLRLSSDISGTARRFVEKRRWD